MLLLESALGASGVEKDGVPVELVMTACNVPATFAVALDMLQLVGSACFAGAAA